MRGLLAFAVGGLFGAGLFVSGMTDTRNVQGWLDVTADWDPTLAFVLGGAILPMVFAWRIAARHAPKLGGQFPAAPGNQFDRKLIVGSVLFGVGWGLLGLCPGPALASLTFGGSTGLLFLISMAAGMIAAQVPRIWSTAPPSTAS